MRNSKATNLMTLHDIVHKAATDMLKSSDIANDFVGDSDHRLKHCGTSQQYYFYSSWMHVIRTVLCLFLHCNSILISYSVCYNLKLT